MQTVLVHLERLRRHYESAVRTYDVISLLDLSHSLRMWADLKQTLPSKFSTTLSFKTAIPARKILKRSHGYQFVYSYLSGRVRTYANLGDLASGPGIDKDSKITIASSVYFSEAEGYMEIGKFCVVFGVFDEEFRRALEVENCTRCNYVQWLGAECVRANQPDSSGNLKLVAICRETLIRRVANTLDGSHPAPPQTQVPENDFDSTVRYLLQFKVGGLPLPYFILLKCAQDILAIAPKLLAA